jgi:uncharacterized protein YbaR (Trm112 family)
MKIWLFDILACPIDKHFPLKLYIFSFEDKKEKFQSLIDIYLKRDIGFIENERIIETFFEKNEFFLKDDIIIEKTKLKPYLNKIKLGLEEFKNIHNNTSKQVTKKCFEILTSIIPAVVNNFSKNPNANQLSDILPELYLINKIKLDFEIKSGLLFCSNCLRWYPIIDTIPQMLPDKYRKKKDDLAFLENHKNLLDKKFLNQDLKPVKI